MILIIIEVVFVWILQFHYFFRLCVNPSVLLDSYVHSTLVCADIEHAGLRRKDSKIARNMVAAKKKSSS